MLDPDARKRLYVLGFIPAMALFFFAVGSILSQNLYVGLVAAVAVGGYIALRFAITLTYNPEWPLEPSGESGPLPEFPSPTLRRVQSSDPGLEE
jgi:hypothetical protein